jgi:WD40 repeat protein
LSAALNPNVLEKSPEYRKYNAQLILWDTSHLPKVVNLKKESERIRSGYSFCLLFDVTEGRHSSFVIFCFQIRGVFLNAYPHTKDPTQVRFFSDERYIVTTGADHKVLLWTYEYDKYVIVYLRKERITVNCVCTFH